MEIRIILPEEWEIYRDIRLESLRIEPVAFKSNYIEEANRSEDIWRSKIVNTKKPCSYKLFALEDGKAVGMMGLYQDRDGKDPDTVNVFGVYISPEYRGKRISSQLLDKIIKIASEIEGIHKVRLTVNMSQIPAIALYKKHGFKIIEESKKEKSYLMELVL
ncbi:MAG: GNAT family N-acetyltransferase [bacterium]